MTDEPNPPGDIDHETKKILDLRFAKGEITEEEYNRSLQALAQAGKRYTHAPFHPGSPTNEESIAPPPPPPAPRPEPVRYPDPDRAKPSDPSSSNTSTGFKDSDIGTAVALSRSYVGPAFLTWILYYIGFYIIGLIVNLAYLSSAGSIHQETKVSPSGRGCLQFLLFTHFWLPLIVILFLMVAGTHIGFGVADLFAEINRWFQRTFF